MHAGSHFKLKEALLWTRRDIAKFLILSSIVTILYELGDLRWLSIPWVPVTLIGTAVAFLIGFKNNATYDRLWEARKIWGAIVNDSRTWGIMVRDFISNGHATDKVSESELHDIHTRLIYRHVAWMAALRHQLRQPRVWENIRRPENQEYRKLYKVPEDHITLEEEFEPLLSKSEQERILKTKNRATQLIAEQSAELKSLRERGLIDDFRHVELENLLRSLYDQQGKCERIKNFPYPRQFATLNRYFVWLFLLLIPFGLIAEFEELGHNLIWMNIPFSILVSWVFYTLEKIGETSENPFQSGANDIPMTNMSRTIEIDLREILGETELPEPITPVHDILM